MQYSNNKTFFFPRANDTAELMMAAAQVAPLSSSELDSADTTQALLKTFAWVEPPEDDACCTVLTNPPQCDKNQQFNNGDQRSNQSCMLIISSVMHPYSVAFQYSVQCPHFQSL